MARKEDEIVLIPANGRAGEENPEDMSFEDVDSAERAFRAAMADADAVDGVAVWHVYRQGVHPNDPFAPVGQWPVDQYDSLPSLCMMLGNTYGGGNYRIMLRKAGKVRANRLVPVLAPVNIPSTIPAMHGNSETAQLAQLFMRHMEASERRMTAIMERLSAPAANPGQEFDAMLDRMAKMRQAMGEPAKAEKTDPMAMMREMMATITGMMGMTRDLREQLGEAIAPRESPDLVGQLLPLGAQFMELWKGEQELRAAGRTLEAADLARRQRAPNPAPRAPLANAPRPAAPPAPPGGAGPTAARDKVGRILATINGRAAADADGLDGNDPETVARELRGNPQIAGFLGKVLEALGAKPLRVLAGYCPDVLDFPEWWLDLVDILTEAPAPGNDGTDLASDAPDHDPDGTPPDNPHHDAGPSSGPGGS